MTFSRLNQVRWRETYSSAVASVVSLLCLLAPMICVADGFESSDEVQIIATIDSAKYLKLAGRRSPGSDNRASSLYRKYIGGIEQSFGLRHVEDWPLSSLDETMLVFATTARQPTALLIENISRTRAFNSVQAVRYMRVAASRAPQYIDAEPLASFQDNLAALGLAGSHKWATGQGVRVAIIDTGGDRRHPDLRRRIEQSVDFTNGRSRDFDGDVHGTVIASIIAGSRNGDGMLGIAPDAELIMLKACTERESKGRRIGCDSVALAKALDHAIAQTPGVINLSVVGGEDPLLSRLITAAVHSNITVVGVKSARTDETFPGDIGGVLAVAGDPQGYVLTNPDRPLIAPAGLVLGAIPGGGHDYFSGHSIAVAEISGVVALLLQRKPHLAPDVIMRLLQSASRADTGLVHACDSLSRIVGVPCDGYP